MPVPVSAQRPKADFEAALESLVTDMVSQIPLSFPVGPILWGETYATVPQTKTPGTQVEFEDLAKAFLMLLSAANFGRLHVYVANHLTVKQLVDEWTFKQADDNVASALAVLKDQILPTVIGW
jgi:hypothetical protein